MQANKRNLSEILSQDIRLVAPLFQRPYVWSETDNWEPLWIALVEVFERRLSGKTQRPYFLGALVLDQIPTAVGQVSGREIIDGQQRMTTLQILMQVAKETFAKLGFDHQALLLGKLTRNDIEGEGDDQFKVWPTNHDRDSFRLVMKGQPSAGTFEEAADFFRKRVKAWVESGDDSKERASAFVDGVRKDLVFVAIDLENDDDGQLIFETLNSLGTPLLPSDLVKNLLFRAANAEGLDTEKLYDRHWKMFEVDSAYWRAKVNVGRRERIRLDLVLQYYLTYKLSKEPMLAHQFRDYRDALLDGKFGTTEQAISDFAIHARHFREFDDAKEGASGLLRHVLWALDASVPNPLILGIYANVRAGNERDQMLSTLESYLMRRFLCCVTTKRYNQIVADLVGHLNRERWSNDELRRALLAFEGNSSVWPDDGFVIGRTTEKHAYGDMRGVGIAYALSRIEAATRSAKSEVGWNARTPVTIEHVMPQKWEENWPLNDPTDENAIKNRKDLLHRMGNLTVLTMKLNSAISNSAWATKRKHLNKHTVLLINSALAENESWNEESIEARTRDLAEQFCKIWQR